MDRASRLVHIIPRRERCVQAFSGRTQGKEATLGGSDSLRARQRQGLRFLGLF